MSNFTREQSLEWAKKKFFNYKKKLNQEDYEQMLYEQKGVCKICEKPNENGKRLSVDHKHGTNMVRGLLCTLCNTGLGMFKDSPGLLLLAMRYIQISNKQINDFTKEQEQEAEAKVKAANE